MAGMDTAMGRVAGTDIIVIVPDREMKRVGNIVVVH
jgi:hypothetical protein